MKTGLILHTTDFYAAEAGKAYLQQLTDFNSDLDYLGVEISLDDVLDAHTWIDDFILSTLPTQKLHPVVALHPDMPVEILKVVEHYLVLMAADRLMVIVTEVEAQQSLRWLGSQLGKEIEIVSIESTQDIRGVRIDRVARIISAALPTTVKSALERNEIPVAFSIGSDREFIAHFISEAVSMHADEIYFWSWLAAHRGNYLDLVLRKPVMPELIEEGVQPAEISGKVLQMAYVRKTPHQGGKVLRTLQPGDLVSIQFFVERDGIIFGKLTSGEFVAVKQGTNIIIQIQDS